MTAFGAALAVVGIWILIQGINGNAGRLLQGQITLGSLGLGSANNNSQAGSQGPISAPGPGTGLTP